MADDRRAIELEVEVPGTPEEVWRAIATGPGISSWYVPHEVDERLEGTAIASFGEGPEMQVPGRVAAWEPHRRVVFDGGEGAGGLAFEWLIEARDGGTCIVRLVNSGFGTGDDWDDQYDAMQDGWGLFLFNLQLHLEHFAGQTATAVLPSANWTGPQTSAWTTLTDLLGVPSAPTVGDVVSIGGPDGPHLVGTVARTRPWNMALLVEQPAPGTAFIAAEDVGGQISVSIWAYLYGDDRTTIAARDLPRWQALLDAQAIDTRSSHSSEK
jgi:uncharacterized protein YndB with AHSA1/START domain